MPLSYLSSVFWSGGTAAVVAVHRYSPEIRSFYIIHDTKYFVKYLQHFLAFSDIGDKILPLAPPPLSPQSDT